MWLSVFAHVLFWLGLAFYATPSTDEALANLPTAKAGSGAGIYKMASSLGGAIGVAVSLAVFTGLSQVPQDQITQIGDVIHMNGAQSNAPLRLAAMTLGVNPVFLLLGILAITVTVPKEGGRITPNPQPVPDAVAAAGFVECPLCKGRA